MPEMTPKVSLQIQATTPDSETKMTTVSNVNPEATNAQIYQLAQALNSLTKNTFRGAYKVSKQELTSFD